MKERQKAYKEFKKDKRRAKKALKVLEEMDAKRKADAEFTRAWDNFINSIKSLFKREMRAYIIEFPDGKINSMVAFYTKKEARKFYEDKGFRVVSIRRAKKLKKRYFKIFMMWIFGCHSPSLGRRIKFKDIFDKYYLG